MLVRIWYLKKLSVPKALRFMYRHMDNNCGRLKLSTVNSSPNNRATRIISAVVGGNSSASVERTFRKHSPNSLITSALPVAVELTWAVVVEVGALLGCCWMMVSCRNLAISRRIFSSLRFFSSSANLSSNVEGSMLGKSLRATGRRNSMKGTMIKTENGISLSKSPDVLLSYSYDNKHEEHSLSLVDPFMLIIDR